MLKGKLWVAELLHCKDPEIGMGNIGNQEGTSHGSLAQLAHNAVALIEDLLLGRFLLEQTYHLVQFISHLLCREWHSSGCGLQQLLKEGLQPFEWGQRQTSPTAQQVRPLDLLTKLQLCSLYRAQAFEEDHAQAKAISGGGGIAIARHKQWCGIGIDRLEEIEGGSDRLVTDPCSVKIGEEWSACRRLKQSGRAKGAVEHLTSVDLLQPSEGSLCKAQIIEQGCTIGRKRYRPQRLTIRQAHRNNQLCLAPDNGHLSMGYEARLLQSTQRIKLAVIQGTPLLTEQRIGPEIVDHQTVALILQLCSKPKHPLARRLNLINLVGMDRLRQTWAWRKTSKDPTERMAMGAQINPPLSVLL